MIVTNTFQNARASGARQLAANPGRAKGREQKL